MRGKNHLLILTYISRAASGGNASILQSITKEIKQGAII